jgi:hypothetical protein
MSRCTYVLRFLFGKSTPQPKAELQKMTEGSEFSSRKFQEFSYSADLQESEEYNTIFTAELPNEFMGFESTSTTLFLLPNFVRVVPILNSVRIAKDCEVEK